MIFSKKIVAVPFFVKHLIVLDSIVLGGRLDSTRGYNVTPLYKSFGFVGYSHGPTITLNERSINRSFLCNTPAPCCKMKKKIKHLLSLLQTTGYEEGAKSASFSLTCQSAGEKSTCQRFFCCIPRNALRLGNSWNRCCCPILPINSNSTGYF